MAELLELAAAIPIRTEFGVFPLDEVNTALHRVAESRISGAAVLRVG